MNSTGVQNKESGRTSVTRLLELCSWRNTAQLRRYERARYSTIPKSETTNVPRGHASVGQLSHKCKPQSGGYVDVQGGHSRMLQSATLVQRIRLPDGISPYVQYHHDNADVWIRSGCHTDGLKYCRRRPQQICTSIVRVHSLHFRL